MSEQLVQVIRLKIRMNSAPLTWTLEVENVLPSEYPGGIQENSSYGMPDVVSEAEQLDRLARLTIEDTVESPPSRPDGPIERREA